MAVTLFPLQYLRQGADPIDVDSVFNTTSERLAYLSNGRRYPGQIVADVETNTVYVLNDTGDAWLPVGSGGTPGGLDTQVQFNDGGVFGGDSGFTYDKGTNTVGLSNISNTTSINVRVDSGGPVAWYALYGDIGIDAGNETGSAVAYDSAGNVYIAAGTNPGYGLLLKYSPSGNLLWQKRFYDPLAVSSFAGDAIAVDSADNIIVVFQTYTDNFVAAKFDSSGSVIWQTVVDGVGLAGEIATDVVIGPLNSIYISVYTNNEQHIVKLDTNGIYQSNITLTPPLIGGHECYSIAVDSSDNLYQSISTDTSTTVIIKYDSAGAILWQKEYTGGASYQAGMVLDSAGNIYFASYSSSPISQSLVKLDTTGTLVWQKNLVSPTLTGSEAYGLAVDNLDNIYINSTWNDGTSRQLVVFKYDSSGNLLWQRQFGSPDEEYVWWNYGARTIDVYGSVYTVTGYTRSPGLTYRNVISAQFKTDGSGLGTYGNFTYSATAFTVDSTPSTINNASLGLGIAIFTATPSSYTVDNASYVNNTTIMVGPPNWYFNGDGSTQLPGYTLPAADGTCGQALTTDGAGNVSWCNSGGASPATPTTLGTVYAYDGVTSCNTFVGYNAGLTTYQGTDNSYGTIAIGTCAGYAGGNFKSVLIGYNAGQQGTDYGTVAIGHSAGTCYPGPYNVIIGICAGQYANDGAFNTFVGPAAAQRNLGCSVFNTAIGAYGMGCAGAGANNVSVGSYTMEYACDPYACAPGYGNNYNNAIGNYALAYNRGNSNNAFGFAALGSNLEGHCNQAIGGRSLYWNETGCNNIGIGNCAGYCLVSGSDNTIIGSLPGTAGLQCTVLIGAGACERVKVDGTGLYINGVLFSGGGSPATPITLGTVFGYTSGCGNISVGCCAGNTTNTGKDNIAIGCNSLISLIGANCGNIALGTNSIRSLNYGYGNIGIGCNTLRCLTYNLNNIAIGSSSLECATGGNANIAIGVAALQKNCNGSYNIALGQQALYGNVGGNRNIAIGDSTLRCNTTGTYNVAVGISALPVNDIGCNNVAVGYGSLYCNTSGSYNVGVGPASARFNSTGNCNVAVGYLALHLNCVGSGNIGIGTYAGCQITTGNNNTVIGSLTAAAGCVCTLLIGAGTCERVRVDNSGLYINGACWCSGGASVSAATPTSLGTVFGYTTGSGNTAIGCCAGNTTQTGANNIVIGCLALRGNGYGNSNVAQGYKALCCNSSGNNNVAIGFSALAGNTFGSNNLAIGRDALRNNTIGSNNIAQGFCALGNNCNGIRNIAQGYNALYCNISGSNNVAQGFRALNGNLTGSDSIAIGYGALCLYNATGGNIAIGCLSGAATTTGQDNISIGQLSLRNNTTGFSNISIGVCSGCLITTGVNNTVIGSLPAAAGCVCTLLIGAGTCERIRVDNTGLYVNGSLVSASLATPTSIGTVFGYTTGSGNTAIGCCAGNTTMTGLNNTAIGCAALLSNTGGCNNIGVGINALVFNTVGNDNIGLGSSALRCNTSGFSNIALGLGSLFSNTIGTYNVAIGDAALCTNTTGGFNIAVGPAAMQLHRTGQLNVAIGYLSQRQNYGGNFNISLGGRSAYQIQTGTSNVAIGYRSMEYGLNPSNNIAMGCRALQCSSTDYNIAIGTFAGFQVTTGGNNTLIGFCAGLNITTGANNTVIGSLSAAAGCVCTLLIGAGTCERIRVDNTGLYVNGSLFSGASLATPTSIGTVFGYTTGSGNTSIGCCAGNTTMTGTNNIAIGCLALSANTTGSNNIAVGFNSLLCNTTGCDNIALGYKNLLCNNTGYSNVALGKCALQNNTIGGSNIAIGDGALCGTAPHTGTDNIAIGRNSVACSTGGCGNIGIGFSALNYNCAGNNNVAIGSYAGYRVTGANNILIGCAAGCRITNASNIIAIGTGAGRCNDQANLSISIGSSANGYGLTGLCNIAIGVSSALCSNGCHNIAIGANSLLQNITGTFNLAIGVNSLQNNSNSTNIGIGYCAGCNITTGTNNTVIGSLPAAAACVCTVLIGAGTCERAKIDNAGLCINGSLLSQGDGLSTTAAGWRITPVNSQSADYPLVADDSGKLIFHPASDANARTYTIPANGSVAYPVGTTITFANDSSSNITIAITTDTLVLVGSGATGSRTLSQYGVATAVKVESTKWYISGTNLT